MADGRYNHTVTALTASEVERCIRLQLGEDPDATCSTNNNSDDSPCHDDAALSIDCQFTQHVFVIHCRHAAVLCSLSVASSSKLNVSAAVFVPRAQLDFGQSTVPWSTAPPVVTANLGHLDPIEEIEQVIYCLTCDPGSFDLIMEPLAESLARSINSEATLLAIIDMLMTQAVGNANFRYTGARMMNYLAQHLLSNLGNGNFRQQLMKCCHDRYLRCIEMMLTPDSQDTVIGFTLLLGELLANVTLPRQGGCVLDAENNRLKVLAEALIDLLLLFLNQPDDARLKCTAQVLKMTGAIIEEMAAPAGSLPKYPHIFTMIEKVLTESSCDRYVKAMLLGVLELRADRWGQTDECTGDSWVDPMIGQEVVHSDFGEMVTMPPPNADYMLNQIDSVNAGGDWQLTENEFYINEFNEVVYVLDEDASEMDDEMSAAYEDYLRDNESKHS